MAIVIGTLRSDDRTGTDGRDLILSLFGDGSLDGAGMPTDTEAADAAIERRSDLADRLYGGSGKDTILGAGGGDTIDGGSGDDAVRGGGVDRLTGGPGDNTFIFGFEGLSLQFSPQEHTSTGEGRRNVITDFQQGQDLLDLTGYGPTLVSVDPDPGNDRTILSFQVSRGSGQIEFVGGWI